MKTPSLRLRVSALLGAATVLVLGIAAAVIDRNVDREMQRRFDAALLARAQALAALTRQERGGIEVENVVAAMAVFPGAEGAAWSEVDCAGAVVARAPETAAIADWPLARNFAVPAFRDIGTADGAIARAVAFRFAPEPGDSWGKDPAARAAAFAAAGAKAPECTVRVAQDRRTLDQILDAVDAILITSIVVALLAVLALTPLLVRAGLRPLGALAEAMRGIGPHDPGRRLEAARSRELEPLVARFNEVLARMDAGLAREREFAAGLAHELRTRLAELRALVDVETRYPSERKRGDLFCEIGAIGAELEASVAALLQLTRIESGVEQPHLETLRLAPLVERLRQRHAPRAAARRIVPVFGPVSGGLEWRADPALLEIVLDNLLANAIDYAPAGAEIRCTATTAGIDLVNPAPDLDSADLARLGQRFWRKREGGGGHAGLGLALATAAARAMHLRLAFRLDDGVLHATLLRPEPGGSTGESR